MESTTPVELVHLLRGHILRVRTGLYLLPVPMLTRAPDEAARLGIHAVDSRDWLLKRLPEGTRFSGITVERLLELVDEICREVSESDCLLIYDFDLLVARLKTDERAELWRQLYSGFPHRPRALLIAMPRNAKSMLPRGDLLTLWLRDRRMAECALSQ